MIVVLFGAAVAMFGGGSDSNSYTPVSAEVEAYEPIIQKYAKEYGIPEYVELIKAVMMLSLIHISSIFLVPNGITVLSPSTC